MEVKLFELRDAGTFIPVIAIKPDSRSEVEFWLLERAGYGDTQEHQRDYVLFGRLDGTSMLVYDPFEWGGSRTMHVAHQYAIDRWNDLVSGEVIDVEFILGLKAEPKESEQVTEG